MILKKVRGKNFFSIGNAFLEFDIQKYSTAVLTGRNGEGKCLSPRTKINIMIKDSVAQNAFLEFLKSKNIQK